MSTGEPAERGSLAGPAGYREEGGNAVVMGGYGRLVAYLAKGLDVRTGARLTDVVDRGREVGVRTVTVFCRADLAVVAVRLRALKAGTVTFDPPLPPTHTSAIQALAMGTVEKVVLGFGKRFWPVEYGAWPGSSAIGPFRDGATSRPIPASRLSSASTTFASPVPTAVRRDSPRLGLEALRSLFGEIPVPAIAHATDWFHDPDSLGSYSCFPCRGILPFIWRHPLTRPL